MRFRNVGLVEGGKLKTQVTELEGKCQKPFAKEKTYAQHAKKKKTNTLQTSERKFVIPLLCHFTK